MEHKAPQFHLQLGTQVSPHNSSYGNLGLNQDCSDAMIPKLCKHFGIYRSTWRKACKKGSKL